MKRNCKGFTIVELMIVVVVLGIFCGLGTIFVFNPAVAEKAARQQQQQQQQQQIAKENDEFWTPERIAATLVENVSVDWETKSGSMPNCQWTKDMRKAFQLANPDYEIAEMTPNSAPCELRLPNLPQFRLSDIAYDGNEFVGLEGNTIAKWRLVVCERQNNPTMLFKVRRKAL